MEFIINKCPYVENQQVFLKKKLELQPNTISCFVGCNGSGKTALIKEIQNNICEKFKAREISSDFYRSAFADIFGKDKKETSCYYISFDKRTKISSSPDDYFKNAMRENMESTGENIISRLGNQLQKLASIISSQKLKDKKLFIFFDDCDAGTSIDMINDIKDVFSLVTNDCKRNNIEYYIVITANSYEMCRDLDCISVQDFKHKTFKSYETFKKFVLKTKDVKNYLLEKDKENYTKSRSLD